MPDSLLKKLRAADPKELDTRFEHLDQVAVVQPQDSLAFSCRGCGDKCCTTETPIVLSIPEVWRMTWQILRTPGMANMFRRTGMGATVAYLGHSSGLPVQLLNKLDGHCVFLTPFGEGGTGVDGSLFGCAIHDQRPNTCRVFPLGRIIAYEQDGTAIQEEYVLSSRCPGFDAAGPGEIVLDGYLPPNAGQTVQDWVDLNLPKENRTETALAFEIFKRFMDEGFHAPTEAQPGGKLNTEFVMSALLRLFYVPPAPPKDSSLDHALIMGRLEVLRDEGAEMVLAAYEKWPLERG